METEKIKINIKANYLRQVDVLVEQGVYANRTEFINTAIHNQTASHANDFKNVRTSGLLGLDLIEDECNKVSKEFEKISQYISNEIKLCSDITAIGILLLNARDLEGALKVGKKLTVKMVGMLIINKDVSLELAAKAFKSVKVYGIILASAEVKKIIAGL